MSKRTRQYIGILAALAAYYLVHEGAHLLYALFYRRIEANQLYGTWRSNRRICRAHDKYAAWNLLPCGCFGNFLYRIPARGTCEEHLPRS